MSGERSNDLQYINKLRILAIYAVVTAHVTIWMTLGTKPLTFNWWLGCWIHFACLWSIPVFVMISGALLLSDFQQESAWTFYRRRIRRIATPLIFWTLVYLAVRKVVGHEQLTAVYITKLLMTAEPYYHLWFLYMIIGLYLVTPLLRTYVRHSSTKERWLAIVTILLLANAYSQANALFWNVPRSVFTIFIPYIGYYLCGYELRFVDHKKIPSKYLAAAVAVSAIYIAALTNAFVERKTTVSTSFIFGFFSPPVVFMSTAIFWAAYIRDYQAKPLMGIPKIAVQWVASTTLGIYVMHPMVLEYIRDRLGKYAAGDTFLLGVIAVPLVTFVTCYLITSLIMNIPLLRRTVC